MGVKLGGTFQTWKDPQGNTLASINRDGSFTFSDGTIQTSAFPNTGVTYVDGKNYTLDAVGIQAAVNAAQTGGGMQATVFLPDGTINLGNTTLHIPRGVRLVCSTPGSCWLTYSGTGSAVDFAAGVSYCGLTNVTIYCTSGSATGINIHGDFLGGNPTIGVELRSVTVSFPSISSASTGINFDGLASPASIQTSYFENVRIFNAGNSVVANGTEGNIWVAMEIVGGATGTYGFVQQNSNDNHIQGRVAGPNGVTGAFNNVTGNFNVVQLIMDIGAVGGVQDLTSKNTYILSPVNPTTAFNGSVPTNDIVLENGTGSMYAQKLTLNGTPSFQNAPCFVWSVYLGGNVNQSSSHYQNWTPDRAIVVTRVEIAFDTNSLTGFSTNPIIRVTDGVHNIDTSITSAFSFDTGAISQVYTAGSQLTISTVAGVGGSGGTSGARISVQYRMQ